MFILVHKEDGLFKLHGDDTMELVDKVDPSTNVFYETYFTNGKYIDVCSVGSMTLEEGIMHLRTLCFYHPRCNKNVCSCITSLHGNALMNEYARGSMMNDSRMPFRGEYPHDNILFAGTVGHYVVINKQWGVEVYDMKAVLTDIPGRYKPVFIPEYEMSQEEIGDVIVFAGTRFFGNCYMVGITGTIYRFRYVPGKEKKISRILEVVHKSPYPDKTIKEYKNTHSPGFSHHILYTDGTFVSMSKEGNKEMKDIYSIGGYRIETIPTRVKGARSR